MGKHFLVPPKLDTVAAAAGKIWTASDSDGNGDWVDHDTVYYKQGGNAFSDTAVLGTTDNYDLQLKTNDIQWAVLKNTGELGIGRETTAQQRLTVNYGNLRFNTVPQPGNHTASLAGLGAGNLSNGTYYYVVIPVTIYGDCGYNQRSNSSVVVVDNTVNGQIQLTNIPVFAEKYQVIARKIYRTRVGESNTSARYLTIINDNTTTTYLDNTADASLPNGRVYGKPDMSSAVIYKNGELMMFADTYNTSFGEGALGSAVNADGITAIGANAGGSITDAIGGVFIGNNAGMSITTGQSNVFIASSGNGLTTGTYNVGIGGAMVAIGSVASNNICLGREAGGRVTAEYNVFIGRYAGRYQGTGSYNIGFGSNTMHGVSGTTPTGSYNFSAGYLAMGSGALTSAAQNIAIGYTSLRFLVSGSSNIAFGSSSGTSVTTGAINIFIGSSSGSTLQTGSYNMYIGHSVAASAIDISNEFRLGYSTTLLLNGHMGTGPFLNVPVEFRTAGDVVFNGIGTATESNVLYYNTTTKKITYGAAPSSSVSFGTEGQIPYTNATVDDFNYSSKFSWNNTAGILLIDQTLRSPNSTGTGVNGKNLIIKAGNAWSGDNTSSAGVLFLSPGNFHGAGAINSLTQIGLGDPDFNQNVISVTPYGTESNIQISIYAKGNGSLHFGNGSGNIALTSTYLYLINSQPISLAGSSGVINRGSSYNQNGRALTIIGAVATVDPPENTDTYNGGSVYIYGGTGINGGARGDIYFGNGSNGYLPAKAAETNVVYYDTTTGKLSYGTVSAGTTYTFQHSLTESAGNVNLVNDTASPGNSKLYGTNGSGTRGWYDIPAASNWSVNSGRLYRNSKVLIGNGTNFGSYYEQLILHNTSGVSGLRIIQGTSTGTGWTIGTGCTIESLSQGDLYFYTIYEQNRIVFGHQYGDLTMPGTLKALIGEFTGGYGIKISNPAKTFSYDIVPAAISADRTLNLPLTTGATDTLATLGLAQTFTGNLTLSGTNSVQGNTTFDWQKLRLRNYANTASFILTAAGISADCTLTIPNAGTADTLAALGVDQTFTGISTFRKQNFYSQSGTSIIIQESNHTTYAGKVVLLTSSSSVTVTINYNTPTNFHATFIRVGSGEITFAGGTSGGTVTIYSSGSKKRIDVRYEAAYVIKTAAGTVYLTGSLKT